MSNCEQDDGAAGMTTRPAGPGQRTPEQEENLARLAGIKDEDIDTSDIAELTKEQWSRAEFLKERPNPLSPGGLQPCQKLADLT
jgi:hypothetical protein